MRTPWVGLGCLVVMIGLLGGCKTPPPQLKPAATPEELSSPPIADSRYDYPNYPKQALAFNTGNDKRAISANNAGMGPTFGGQGAGGGGGMGMGGMGGMAGR